MKNYILNTCSLVIAAVVMVSSGAQAQVDTIGVEQNEELDLNVVITGDAQLFLNDANKVINVPELKESAVELPPMTYYLIPRKPEQKIELKPVPAAKVNMQQKLPNLFRGYVKGAVGTNLTGLGEIRFMDGYSRNGTFDSFLKFRGSDGRVALVDSIPDTFSNLSLGVSGKRFLKKQSVGINLGYDRDMMHYFGYDPELYPENFGVDEQRIYRTFNAGVNIKSYFRDSTKLNYVGRFDFLQFSDNADGSENNFVFDADFNQQLERKNLVFAMGVNIDYNQLKNRSPRTLAIQKFNNTVIALNPRLVAQQNGFTVRVGARLVGDFMGALEPKIYPDLEANYSLFEGVFIPYIGLGGDLHKNRYRTLADENPFIQSFLIEDIATSDVLMNTNEKINVFGGIRGNISSNMSFNTKISRASFDNFVYFVNDTIVSQGNRFRTEYGELVRTTVTGELTYNAGEKIKFFGRGDFYIYDEKMEEEPWNQPDNKITVSASYNIDNKIVANLDVYAIGKRRAKSLGFIEGGILDDDGYFTYNLKPFLDATLKAEYRYTKRLSVYAQINNILAGRYERFNNFPTQRLNFLAGATYAF
ncbi:MAG: hypothetical protein AB8B53_01730 [Flavobacteriales bacterium]